MEFLGLIFDRCVCLLNVIICTKEQHLHILFTNHEVETDNFDLLRGLRSEEGLSECRLGL